jgi:hypothetical protein
MYFCGTYKDKTGTAIISVALRSPTRAEIHLKMLRRPTTRSPSAPLMIDSGHDKVKIPRRSTTVAEEIVLFELHGNLVAAGWLQEAPRKCLATTATLHGYIECWTHARAACYREGHLTGCLAFSSIHFPAAVERQRREKTNAVSRISCSLTWWWCISNRE